MFSLTCFYYIRKKCAASKRAAKHGNTRMLKQIEVKSNLIKINGKKATKIFNGSLGIFFSFQYEIKLQEIESNLYISREYK